jgi:hypothetical protein
MIGKIKRVPLREVWRHEAHDFTRWLEDNPDVLSEVIDLNLENEIIGEIIGQAETTLFPILWRKEGAEFGDFRTKEEILKEFDRLPLELDI